MARQSWQVSDLVARLNTERDPWRERHGFSAEMDGCQQVLFDPAASRAEMAEALNGWLAQWQPCLFWQMEARRERLHFCILTENDLERSDQDIRARIAQERADWRVDPRAGSDGWRSAQGAITAAGGGGRWVAPNCKTGSPTTWPVRSEGALFGLRAW